MLYYCNPVRDFCILSACTWIFVPPFFNTSSTPDAPLHYNHFDLSLFFWCALFRPKELLDLLFDQSDEDPQIEVNEYAWSCVHGYHEKSFNLQ